MFYRCALFYRTSNHCFKEEKVRNLASIFASSASEPTSFRNRARYMKSKGISLSFDDWPMFSPNLVEIGPPPSEE